ncbi:MAG TPA: type III polyketide synthase [Roseiflexaceae bacterium]|nr:type III polyketide synthase [Roseiflexaceae bacterium]
MRHTQVTPAILGLGTAVPPHCVAQSYLSEWLAEALAGQPALARWVRSLYRLSGIETRHSCLPDASLPPGGSRFAPTRSLQEAPTTAERMAIYAREAPAIGVAAARGALADLVGDAPEEVAAAAASVTHLIAVSCTGFFAPGLDLAIADRLGLRHSVERTLVGFMGCSAAFNGMRLAAAIVRARPEARVLVVCAELCSIHAQPELDRVNLTVTSLFADGAAACLVGDDPHGGRERIELDRFATAYAPDTADAMSWRIGDHGFRMTLSPQVPRIIGQIAPAAVEALLDGRPRPRHWAIHPGGPSIVDQVAEALGLSEEQAAPSRAVLRGYGNMSSPTILFVLRELRERLRAGRPADPQAAVAMAFGPGLVAELAHMTYVPAGITIQHDDPQTRRREDVTVFVP